MTGRLSKVKAGDCRISPKSAEAFLQSGKKQWVRPEVVPVTFAEAREKLAEAAALIESDSELQAEFLELRSLIEAMDREIGQESPEE